MYASFQIQIDWKADLTWICNFNFTTPGVTDKKDILNILFNLTLSIGHAGMSYKYRPRSDILEFSIWSVSALFDTHPAVLEVKDFSMFKVNT